MRTDTPPHLISKALRVLAAIVASVITGLIALVLFGILLPVWTMMLIDGKEGGKAAGFVLDLTFPAAALIVAIGIVPFGRFVYRKMSQ